MATQEHLTLRMVRLRPREEWGRNGQGLAFVLAKKHTGRRSRCHWWIGPGAAALAILTSGQGRAQDALQVLRADLAAAGARRSNLETQPYTLKVDEFRMLASSGLDLDWNDNVNAAQHGAESDFVVRPTGLLTASYPVTQNSLLSLNVTAGYSKYLEHDEFSAVFIGSGSGLALDLDAGQFTFDVHDRMQYIQDSTQQSSVAGTGLYGLFDNAAGLMGTWDLNDLAPSLGYDHENYIASSSSFSYTTHASEDFFARTTLRVQPRLSLGLEATAAFTTYQEKVLNDSTDLSAGLFAERRPNSAFRLTARGGYVAYLFDQTGTRIPASNQDTWYVDVTATDQVTDKISAGLSAGRELRLGISSDVVTVWYARPGLAWRVLRDVSARATAAYENGSQDLGVLPGSPHEGYDWCSIDLGLTYSARRNIIMSLDYRLTLRYSNVSPLSYTQDQIGFTLTYAFQ